MSELIYELYEDMPQDAPGDNQSTPLLIIFFLTSYINNHYVIIL